MKRRTFLGILSAAAVAPAVPVPASKPGVGFHRNCFALVSEPLPLDQMPNFIRIGGWNCRHHFDWDAKEQTLIGTFVVTHPDQPSIPLTGLTGELRFPLK